MENFDETLKGIFEELSEQLQHVYGDRMKEVILYGSVARREQTSDSDIDIMVLIDVDPEEMRNYEDALCEVSTDMALKYLKVFSIIDVNYQEFNDWKAVSPFYKNVSDEGVVLYAA